MVELRFNVSEVDYDSILQALAGRLPPPMVMAARAMPDSAKEDMVVKFINSNGGQIDRWLENTLAANGVRMKISGACASKKD